MKKIYEYDKDTGELRATTDATPNPHKPGEYRARVNATFIAPPTVGEKEKAVFADGAWVVKPDHRGVTYYIRKESRVEAVTIKELGVAVPDGGYLNIDDVPLTPAEDKSRKLVEIDARLAALDAEAIRPLRAIAAGTATDVDHSKLADLDAQAAAFRAQRAALSE